ncbi:MAG: tRNA (adenosine(37)-N6)-dimethylallyltransferase MiaA [Hyphomicrobiales bacterium]
MQHSAVLIAGATASGKSALAIEIAARLGGIVVNADAMQVYRELSVLTARPGAGETARLAHRLYGHVPAATRFSVGAWLAELERELAEARAAGKVPVIVGGTGLYFKAATEGLVSLPPIPADLRRRIAGEAETAGIASLHERLAGLDPDGAARIRPSDRTRVIRALEVVEATGRPLGAWQAEAGPEPLVDIAASLPIVLDVSPAFLGARIERRCRAMIDEGAVEEAVALTRLGLDPELPAMKAIGVAPFAALGAGELGLEDAIQRTIVDTRRYAKRQRTWFRNQISGWLRLEPPFDDELADRLADDFLAAR